MQKKHLNIICLFGIIICSFFSCNSEENKFKISEEELNKIQVDLVIERMEKDVFDSSKNPEEKHQFLLSKYGSFYQDYLDIIIGKVDPNATNNQERLENFAKDSTLNLIYNDLEKEFKNFQPHENELKKAFKYYKFYFEDAKIPKIITFYSNFNNWAFYDYLILENDTISFIAIGVESFLGKENEYIKKYNFPNYFKNKMEKKFLSSTAMYVFLRNRFYTPLGNDLISNIIAEGKIYYLLSVLMPDVKENIIMMYNQNELSYCKDNESFIWEKIRNDKLPFSKDKRLINDFISFGPFTKQFGPKSPAYIGKWLGLQIIKDFAEASNKSNKEIIMDIIEEKDVQKLLSTYDPK